MGGSTIILGKKIDAEIKLILTRIKQRNKAQEHFIMYYLYYINLENHQSRPMSSSSDQKRKLNG